MWVIPRRFICSLSLAANEPPRNSPSVKENQSERERVKQSWQSFRHNFTILPLTEITQSDCERVATCFLIIEGVKRTCKQESEWNQWEELHGGTYASEKIEATMEKDTRRRLFLRFGSIVLCSYSLHHLRCANRYEHRQQPFPSRSGAWPLDLVRWAQYLHKSWYEEREKKWRSKWI
jgi:hypothetical protein